MKGIITRSIERLTLFVKKEKKKGNEVSVKTEKRNGESQYAAVVTPKK